jgi:hypothetical protein
MVKLLSLTALLAACQKDIPVDVSVVAPSGANPFAADMGATKVRIGFEGDPMSVREVDIRAGIRFDLDLRPTDPRSTSRLRVDVLRDTTIIAQGATPSIAWLNVGSQQLRVFVQQADSVVLAPGGAMHTARADFVLVSAGPSGAMAFTLPAGARDAKPDYYFLPSHSQRPFTFSISAAFDGDTAVVPLHDGGVLLLRGERALVFTDTSEGAAPATPIPPERRALRGASVARDSTYSYVIGGHDDRGIRSARIDRVTRLGDVEPVTYGLATARARAGILLVRPGDPPTFLVYGGQDPACATCASMELWTPGAAGVAVPPLGASIDRRSEFEAVCIQRDADRVCTRLLILGGVDNSATATLAAKDVLLDVECLRRPNAGPACVLTELELLSSRRRAMRAALGDDGRRVVVTGGRDAMGASNYVVDVIDARDVAALRRLPGERILPAADPAVLAMADGSVMIAGGIDRDTNRPTANVWFVRGPIPPL